MKKNTEKIKKVSTKKTVEKEEQKIINIVIPMAGTGNKFKEAGYIFPKPLIDVNGQTMIEIVVKNIKPKVPHKFIFICQREHYEKYDLHNVLKKATGNNFEVVLINGVTKGAACTVLCAKPYINNDESLLIANSDQFIKHDINTFLSEAKKDKKDGFIMTFNSSHPKWSYARINKKREVLEVAEKKVISNKATVGVYFFSKGSDFVKGAEAMIKKNIHKDNEFYVCPVYNEIILAGGLVCIHDIKTENMHGMGTPEDLSNFVTKVKEKKIKI